MRKPNAKEVVAIIKICEYLHHDEKRNWEEMGNIKNHIFTSIKVLEQYLKSIKTK